MAIGVTIIVEIPTGREHDLNAVLAITTRTTSAVTDLGFDVSMTVEPELDDSKEPG